MEISRLELRIDKDEAIDMLRSSIDGSLEGAYYEAEEAEVNEDGSLTARVGAEVYWDAEEVEYRLRTEVLVDKDTGDFDEPPHCSMEKSVEYDSALRDFVFGYNIPTDDSLREERIAALEATLATRDETIAFQNRKLRLVELLRQLCVSQEMNAGQHSIEMVDITLLRDLLDTIRWGDKDKFDIVEANIDKCAKGVQEATAEGRRQGWSTPAIV